MLSFVIMAIAPCGCSLLPKVGTFRSWLTFNGLDLSSSLKQNRWYRWSLMKALPKLAAVVVVGEHQERWMRDHRVPEEKPAPNPLRRPNDRVPAIAESSRRSRVGSCAVGRFVPKKSPLNTIRAFAASESHAKGATLTMIGDGPLHEAASGLAKELGVQSHVTFSGEPAQRSRERGNAERIGFRPAFGNRRQRRHGRMAGLNW